MNLWHLLARWRDARAATRGPRAVVARATRRRIIRTVTRRVR